ncbi:aldehyde dehydrogenase family protein, partial [Paraburkholderia sp. SIMBA_049]
LIVHKHIAEPLIDAVQRELAGIAPGAMWSSATRYSPIISPAQAQRIATLIDESRAQGAEVLCGGGFFEDTEDGWFHR